MADVWGFEKLGLGYRCWAEDIDTEFRLTHIKRSSREGLSGEIKVKTTLAGVKTNKGVLHVSRINIMAATTRSSLAKMLAARAPGHDLDWHHGLETLCQEVILAEQEGEKFEEVGCEPKTPIRDQFLVEPLLLRDRPGMIFGPGGSGKSLLALTCGLSVAAGREIIPGIFPRLKGPVLYLDWETTGSVINDRIQSIAAGHGFDPPKILYRRCIKPLADDAEKLSEIVAERKVIMVIVDSAAYAMGSSGEYGDANESVLRMHEGLRIMGATALIVDHVNKVDQKAKPGTATPYGSAYKTNAVRISWEVRKGPDIDDGLRINLYHAKSNDTRQLEPIGLELDWDEDKIIFKQVSMDEIRIDPVIEKPDMSIPARILSLLSDGDRLSKAAIPGLLNLDDDRGRAAIRQALHRLEKLGRTTEDDQGKMVWVTVTASQLRLVEPRDTLL